MTTTNPFRKFHRNHCTLYPRVWCEQCLAAADDFLEFGLCDHKHGLCEVCGERGTEAHLHVWSVNADRLYERLENEFHWRFEPSFPIATAAGWSYTEGVLVLAPVGEDKADPPYRFSCVGQMGAAAMRQYGPRGVVTSAIRDGAAKAGMKPPPSPEEGVADPLQPLVGVTTSRITPEPPTTGDTHQLTAALDLCDEHKIKPADIRTFIKTSNDISLSIVKDKKSPASMLMATTAELHGTDWTTDQLTETAEWIKQ